jgi:hypothetical protein
MILAFAVDSAFAQRFACSLSYFVAAALPNEERKTKKGIGSGKASK